jgi:hypothetical protein
VHIVDDQAMTPAFGAMSMATKAIELGNANSTLRFALSWLQSMD